MDGKIRVVFRELDNYKEKLLDHKELTNTTISNNIGSFGNIKNKLSSLNGKRFSSLNSEFNFACTNTENNIEEYILYLNDITTRLSNYIEKQKIINSK